MRRRFFVEHFAGNTAVMEGDTAHHLGRVLRAQQGQLYELSDGQRVCLARIEKVSRDRVDFALLEEIPAYQPRVEVTLLLAVVKFDAFEWAIEKATELGVSTIVPLAASRSEKALLASAGKRAERWKKIRLLRQGSAPSVGKRFLPKPRSNPAACACPLWKTSRGLRRHCQGKAPR